MKNHEFFEREILNIEDEPLRDFVRFFFDNYVGEWFWKSGASASGKYHPIFAQGEGGLVRHTRAVEWVCEELLRMNTYAYMKPIYKDYARAACLLHDTRKYGATNTEDKTCYAQHGALAAEAVDEAWLDYFGNYAPDFLLSAIRSHMGQWVENKEDRPFTNIDRLVHLSDYISSWKFWDIADLTNQYLDDTGAFDYPF